MNRVGFIASSLLILLALLSSSLFVVDQRQFGVVFALGQIKNVITEPGLHVKLPPPFQNVSYIDKRLLVLESVDAEPMLTAEKQRVVIDWYVRWRITEPTEYIRNVGLNEAAGANQLNIFFEGNEPHKMKDPKVVAVMVVFSVMLRLMMAVCEKLHAIGGISYLNQKQETTRLTLQYFLVQIRAAQQQLLGTQPVFSILIHRRARVQLKA